jgi:hypothetical protein
MPPKASKATADSKSKATTKAMPKSSAKATSKTKTRGVEKKKKGMSASTFHVRGAPLTTPSLQIPTHPSVAFPPTCFSPTTNVKMFVKRILASPSVNMAYPLALRTPF